MRNVEITTEEYTELLRAKTIVDFLQEAYNRDETLGVDYIMKAVFKKEGGNK